MAEEELYNRSPLQCANRAERIGRRRERIVYTTARIENKRMREREERRREGGGGREEEE